MIVNQCDEPHGLGHSEPHGSIRVSIRVFIPFPFEQPLEPRTGDPEAARCFGAVASRLVDHGARGGALGIKDIIIVTGGQNSGDFLRLLSNGKDFDLHRIHYTYQEG